ncbi:uncharacterized protein LOC134228493 [Saccostrea cucullata]|uniref:uncharacterized protein LOC134228493 n=1 Tax=Saccostrea cuccullata TaxID=36930 RepID=UPI002ED59CB4
MGGKHCCVVGCSNSNEKTKGQTRHISYFSFPKDPEWRSKLIAAVNRSDKAFNPECTYIYAPCTLRRSVFCFMTKRPSAPIPERVTYSSLSNLQKTLKNKDLLGWSILKTDSDILVLGLYDHSSGCLQKTVTVDIYLNVNVRFGEVLVRMKETNLSKVPISNFLQEVSQVRKCSGLPDGQNYSGKVYRFVSTVIRDNKPEVETIVRSQRCAGGVSSDDTTALCPACKILSNNTIIVWQSGFNK